MSRVLHKSNPYDLSKSRKSPIHDHPLYSTTDHGQCAGCFEGKELSAEFLECPICDIFFHKECIESKAEFIHPFHPQHSLWLVKRESLPDTNLDRKCCLCGEELMLLVYRCLICDFKLDMSCAENPPLLEVVQPKVHQHSLHLLMKKVSFTCDACGLEGDRSPYVCLLCNFMFHIRCVYFPDYPQRINSHKNHPHSYSPSRRFWSCGCGSVHSDFVTCESIKEAFEDKPNKDADDETIYPFKIVQLHGGEEGIYHFSHEHHLVFHKDGKVKDVSKRCEACKLPVVYTPYFCCYKGCEFFLHEKCANLPRKKTSILHNHPLELDGKSTTSLEFHEKYFCCSACGQFHDGFKYSCSGFNLDVGCASISLPFKTTIHPHPLTFKSNDTKICGACGLWASPVLCCETVQCNFYLGFDCAQIPSKARHRYDDHELKLVTTKDTSSRGDYWCEICEKKKVDENALFYTCDKDFCCSTFHTHCVLDGVNLKVGFHFTLFSHEFVVVSNTLAAPRNCYICGLNCKGFQVIMSNQRDGDTERYLCSSSCLMRTRHLLENL